MRTASSNVDELVEVAYETVIIFVLLLQWHAGIAMSVCVFLGVHPTISQFQGSPTRIKASERQENEIHTEQEGTAGLGRC